MPCLCGRPARLEACCLPFLDGERTPATAEELMRSRYVAYVRGAMDYLEQTQHPSTRSRFDRSSATEWSRRSRWLGLEVLETVAGGPRDDEGVVSFVARFIDSATQQVQEHRERSRFLRHEGRWTYVDGGAPPARRQKARVGRNDPCPCGSKRKYKRCCGSK